VIQYCGSSPSNLEKCILGRWLRAGGWEVGMDCGGVVWGGGGLGIIGGE